MAMEKERVRVREGLRMQEAAIVEQMRRKMESEVEAE